MKIFSVLCLFLISGCSSLGVQPWERGKLSHPEMDFSENAVETAVDDHVQFSKEGTSGGRGFGGGGCGCN